MLSYYAREGFWGLVEREASELLAKDVTGNAIFNWWRAIAVGFLALMSNCKAKLGEVVRDLMSLRSNRDLELPSIVALVHFHTVHKLIDHKEFRDLETELPLAEDRASDTGLMLAAEFYWYASLRERDIDMHYERLDMARKLLRLVVPLNVVSPSSIQRDALHLLAWIELSARGKTRREPSKLQSAFKFLQAVNCDNGGTSTHAGVIDGRSRYLCDLETSLAKATYFGMVKQFEFALEQLNHAIGAQSWLPALLEKAKLLMAIGDWEQASETIGQAIQHTDGCIGALRLSALHAAIREADDNVVIREIRALAKALEQFETANSELALQTGKALARVTGSRRRQVTLVISTDITEKLAVGINSVNADYIAELGHEQAMLANYAAATMNYRNAGQLDATNEAVVYGVLHCQIANGDYRGAEEQLEFLAALGDSMASTSLLPFYKAKLAWRSRSDRREHLIGLAEAERIHFVAEPSPQLTDASIPGAVPQYDSKLEGCFMSGASIAFGVFNIYESLACCDPEFILALATEYLEHVQFCGKEASELVSRANDKDSEESRAAVARGLYIAEVIGSKLSGDIAVKLLIANAKFVTGDNDGAQRTLARVTGHGPKRADVHLLLARVALAKNNVSYAYAAVEHAIACDFSVRSSPLYHLIKAELLSRDGAHAEALELLESALRLHGVRELLANTVSENTCLNPNQTTSAINSNVKKSANRTVSRKYDCAREHSHSECEDYANSVAMRELHCQDRVEIFVRLAKVQAMFSRFEEAQTTLAEARERFRGTTNELQILLATAELEVCSKNVDAGVRVLDSVSQIHPGYVRAQSAKARLLLDGRQDRASYARIHQDLACIEPSAASYERLGAALIRINAPEAAVEALERAKECNPHDACLTDKIASAIVATHNYYRATEYYALALQTHAGDVELRRNFANLRAKLHDFDGALQLFGSDLDPPKAETHSCDLDNLLQHVRTLLLLADIAAEKNLSAKARDYRSIGFAFTESHDSYGAPNGTWKDAPSCLAEEQCPHHVATLLLRARDGQKLVLEKLCTDVVVDTEAVVMHKKVLATVCKRIAENFLLTPNRQREAINYYKESLHCDPDNIGAILAVARVFLTKHHDIDTCSEHYHAALRVDPSNVEVRTLGAELLLVQQDYEAATTSFRLIVEADPTNYVALFKLVALLRRSGKLSDVPRFIALAERKDPRAFAGPGLNACKGLHARYRNDIAKAVKHFNLARRDVHWGVEALVSMIDLYVNPDNEILIDTSAQTFRHNGTAHVAGNLDAELASFHVSSTLELKISVLHACIKIAFGETISVDAALQTFIDVLDIREDFLPAILGMAFAFTRNKMLTKARNALKRVAKMPYDHEWAAEFEHGYLLLADIYMVKSKFDLAEDLCNVCFPFSID